MNLDAATVIGYSAILVGAVCLLFGLFWIREGKQAQYLWFSVPFAFGGLAHLVLVKPSILPGDWGLRLGAFFPMLAYAAGWQAARVINLRRPTPLLCLLPCFLWFGFYLMAPLGGTLHAVYFTVRTLFQAAFNGLAAYEFWRAREERLPSAMMLFWLFATFAASGFLRSPFVPITPAPLGAAPSELWAIVLTAFLVVVHALLAAGWMIALTRERVAAVHYRMAMIDPLTGIGNRRALEIQTRTSMRGGGEDGRRIALLIFDIDNFKRINDRFGHAFGDKVIIKAAQIAKRALREQDEVFRIGGEEFACMLSDITEQDALAIGERVRRAFERAADRIEDISVGATISIGIALPTRGDDDPGALFAEADAALYEAKHTGRNRTVLSRPRAMSGNDHWRNFRSDKGNLLDIFCNPE